MKRLLLTATALGTIFLAPASAMDMHKIVKASAIQWSPAPPQLPKGAQISVVDGDPGKEGLYIILAKMPDGYAIPAHWHNQVETDARWPVNHPEARRLRSSGQKTAMMSSLLCFRSGSSRLKKHNPQQAMKNPSRRLRSQDRIAHRGHTRRRAAWARGEAWARSLLPTRQVSKLIRPMLIWYV